MRDHDNGVTLPVQLVQEVEHSHSAFRVEVAGRFVGENYAGLLATVRASARAAVVRCSFRAAYGRAGR